MSLFLQRSCLRKRPFHTKIIFCIPVLVHLTKKQFLHKRQFCIEIFSHKRPFRINVRTAPAPTPLVYTTARLNPSWDPVLLAQDHWRGWLSLCRIQSGVHLTTGTWRSPEGQSRAPPNSRTWRSSENQSRAPPHPRNYGRIDDRILPSSGTAPAPSSSLQEGNFRLLPPRPPHRTLVSHPH